MTGKFILYLFCTPILGLLEAVYLLHCLICEFYFEISIIRLAIIRDGNRRKHAPLWQKILSYPLFLIGCFLYIGCMHYLTVPLTLIFMPINLYA